MVSTDQALTFLLLALPADPESCPLPERCQGDTADTSLSKAAHTLPHAGFCSSEAIRCPSILDPEGGHWDQRSPKDAGLAWAVMLRSAVKHYFPIHSRQNDHRLSLQAKESPTGT